MNIITALGNEEINNRLKNINELEIIGKDIQYQEALIDILENTEKIDLLILSSVLPGELNLQEFINIIKYKKTEIEIIIILEKEDKKIKDFIISKGIYNIYYNNKITFSEILEKINEIKNNKIINNKTNKIEKKININKIRINTNKIKNNINKIKKIIINKIINQKKK